MYDGITVKEFKYIPGVNDAEYIKKLEKLHENDRRIISTAVAKIKKLSAQLKEQPEIIHCKDCKFAHMTVNGECKYCDIWFPDEKTYVPGDYFCGSAERKEEADCDYERAVEQLEHDMLYEPTFNPDDGSM